MKKMIILLSMLSMTFGGNAKSIDITTNNIDVSDLIEVYSFKINRNSLITALNMSKEQYEMSEGILETLERNVLIAEKNKDKDVLIQKAINDNLNDMNYILDNKQFIRYKAFILKKLVNKELACK